MTKTELPNSLKNNNKSLRCLLFITWDSDSSNYLESLFFPILKGIQEESGATCHVLQFSWAGTAEVKRIRKLAEGMGLHYIHQPIHRRPLAAVGALLSVYKGVYYIRNYVKEHQINLLMPRSTMPAMMVNRLKDWLKGKQIKVIFDADGLPLEERVDFSGLKANSSQYTFLKREERKIINMASGVITRSKKSVDIHLEAIGKQFAHKFQVVSNGREETMFYFDVNKREQVRNELGLGPNERLWVYTGTLGKSYLVEEMLGLFKLFLAKGNQGKFLIMTRNPDYLEGKVSPQLESHLIVRKGSFADVPRFLMAADLGLSLRSPAPSLAGLAPIKLGEYLLCGLPVLVSRDVGDTEEFLEGQNFCCFYEKGKEEDFLDWFENSEPVNPEMIHAFGLAHFGLKNSVLEYLRVLDFGG
jgi:glycosyltransferase involved in cell wall biosynthesis